MIGAIDILLPRPLPDAWLSGLLFISFTLHLLFALLALGTAFLAVCCYIQVRCMGHLEDDRLDRRIVKSFLGLKSLAVVLGVAPLLLIQVSRTVPMFSAINLLALAWLFLIVLLVVAFVFFDMMGHATQHYRRFHLAFGIVAMAALLAIPGIFAALMITAENPLAWSEMISRGYRLSGPLAIHWLARYLHLIGAAIVLGAIFHYFFSASQERERNHLMNWIIVGMLLQVVFGVFLFGSLPVRPELLANILIMAAVVLAMVLIWQTFITIRQSKPLAFRSSIALALGLLVVMLMVRQVIQDRAMLPVDNAARANAIVYQKKLAPYELAALADYRKSAANGKQHGESIYAGSCTFCHGELADGNGGEVANLSIPPEKIAELRTTREYLYSLLVKGMPGSGMPYFSVFDRNKLDRLIDSLDQRYQVLQKPGNLPVGVNSAALAQAGAVYRETCSGCHGSDGRGSSQSTAFKPPPPDFTRFSMTPRRTFEVITEGYRGTMMSSYATLPEEVRWGLVDHLQKLRTE